MPSYSIDSLLDELVSATVRYPGLHEAPKACLFADPRMNHLV